MYDNLFLVIVSGLINMGCFWLGMKAGSKEPLLMREDQYVDIVEYDKEGETEKTQKVPLRESEVMDGNIEIPD